MADPAPFNPLGSVNIGGRLTGPTWNINGVARAMNGDAGAYQSDLARLDVNPSQLGDVGRLADRTSALGLSGPIPQVGANAINAASNRSRGFDETMRAQQALNAQGMQSLGGLSAAASGMVPSAADLQGRQQLQQALANTAAMGASARGSADSRASAQRQAMQQQAVISGNVVNNASANRAAEQAVARQAYATAIQGQQGAGAQQASLYAAQAQNQAGLQQQAALANQQAAQNAQGANQGAFFQQRAQQVAANVAAAGLYQGQLGAQNQLIDYNNQQSQVDFNRQMAMNSQALQQYGVDRNVALGAYQADQARAAQEQMGQYQMYGSIAQGIGSLTGAAVNKWG